MLNYDVFVRIQKCINKYQINVNPLHQLITGHTTTKHLEES